MERVIYVNASSQLWFCCVRCLIRIRSDFLSDPAECLHAIVRPYVGYFVYGPNLSVPWGAEERVFCAVGALVKSALELV